MQFSLRSLLISFAVAGTGAAVFCSYFSGPYTVPAPWAVCCVIALLSCATLFGSHRARKSRGVRRLAWWLAGPALGAIALIPLAKWQNRQTMISNFCLAAQCCKTIKAAQDNYKRVDWHKDKVYEFAPTLSELCDKGLIDREIANAEWPSTLPYHGYFFRVLTAMKLPTARNYYDENGRMTRGFAVMAWPARYGWTGIDQFLMTGDGTIYDADYGKDPLRRGELTTEVMADCPYWCDDLD